MFFQASRTRFSVIRAFSPGRSGRNRQLRGVLEAMIDVV
jgi:hypothetical protein